MIPNKLAVTLTQLQEKFHIDFGRFQKQSVVKHVIFEEQTSSAMKYYLSHQQGITS